MIHTGGGIQVNNYKLLLKELLHTMKGNTCDCNERLILMGIPGKVTLGSWKLLSSRVCRGNANKDSGKHALADQKAKLYVTSLCNF